MRIRFIAAAVPVLVAGALAAAAPSMSQAAGQDGATQPPQAGPKVAQAEIAPCVGGKQKKALSGGHADWMSTSSSTVVPGTDLSFRGPAKGKDTVFITFTATNTYVNLGTDRGKVRVQLDGADLKPAKTAPEFFYPVNNYASFAGQYCAKVGNGWHDLRVVLESYDPNASGGDIAWLYNPMVHVEVAN